MQTLGRWEMRVVVERGREERCTTAPGLPVGGLETFTPDAAPTIAAPTEGTRRMKPDTRSITTLDLPLGVGRQTLRLILHRDEAGEPDALHLALGYGGMDGTQFHRPGWGEPLLSLPASIMGQLRDGIAALESPGSQPRPGGPARVLDSGATGGFMIREQGREDE